MITGPEEWTLILSKNSSAWGSFSYEESEDALRVRLKPERAPYREWLTYEFLDRQPDRATVALEWEELRVPFTIGVEDMTGLYIDKIRDDLRGAGGFQWQNWDAAAQFCLQKNRNLEEALKWANNAISLPFAGQANFTTYSTKARILEKLNRLDEAQTLMTAALDLPNAGPTEIHQYGRQLLTGGKSKEAMVVFQKNAKRFGDAWPVHVGLARGHSALGDYKTALKHAETAVGQAPDPLNRKALEDAIVRLREGKDMNGR